MLSCFYIKVCYTSSVVVYIAESTLKHLNDGRSKLFKRTSDCINMCIGCIGTVWVQKTIKEKSAIFRKISNYTKLSCIIFCTKMSRYSYYTYWLQEKLIHFGRRVSITKMSQYSHLS